jgi:electron transfer flavoprotein beta subunit
MEERTLDIIVCLKQTFDTEAAIFFDEHGEISSTNVKLIVNPYDEYALEEALLIKEKHGGSVTVVSFGSEKAMEALRSSLAMGADKAVLIREEGFLSIDGWVISEVLAATIKRFPYQIIITGRIAVDDGGSQIPARLAEALGLPFVDSITRLSVEPDYALATNEVDGGTATTRVQLPAVFSAQKGLNDPRYPAMAGILKAKSKPIEIIEASELFDNAVIPQAKTRIIAYSLPEKRNGGRILVGSVEETAHELARLLREEEKVV